MAVRMIVEPQATALAATKASAADLAQIGDAYHRASAETDTAAFEHSDAVFHQRIFAAARNELLLSLHDILRVVRSRNPWIELKHKTCSENRRQDYCTQHAEILPPPAKPRCRGRGGGDAQAYGHLPCKSVLAAAGLNQLGRGDGFIWRLTGFLAAVMLRVTPLWRIGPARHKRCHISSA